MVGVSCCPRFGRWWFLVCRLVVGVGGWRIPVYTHQRRVRIARSWGIGRTVVTGLASIRFWREIYWGIRRWNRMVFVDPSMIMADGALPGRGSVTAMVDIEVMVVVTVQTVVNN